MRTYSHRLYERFIAKTGRHFPTTTQTILKNWGKNVWQDKNKITDKEILAESNMTISSPN